MEAINFEDIMKSCGFIWRTDVILAGKILSAAKDHKAVTASKTLPTSGCMAVNGLILLDEKEILLSLRKRADRLYACHCADKL